MALPFMKNSRKKRDQMLAVDLGARSTKAVLLQRRGNRFALASYAILDTPIFDKVISEELLTEHLRGIAQTMQAKGKPLTLTIGVEDAIVRHVEMPSMPPEDIRLILKNNSRVYLQQELSGYVFDSYAGNAAQNGAATKDTQKTKILIAGAKNQIITNYLASAKNAGFLPDHIVPSIIGPVNAFELAMPEVFAGQTAALVDIGFRSSSICILQEGQLVLNRVVNIGGDRLTAGLAEAMNIGYAEAEGIKVGMPTEVEGQLDMLISPLARELRASIDFFEHQQERTLPMVYVSGGSARSEFIVQALRREIAVECKTWNPVAGLQLALAPAQTAEIEHVAPQLSVAIGAAITAI
ncbi:MAG TPA: pilus assembly protein PilM [Verrucomicrobiae bacterium]|jgi:type IV pilus assembly protein PilM|nr:pilus assembly protein PilM [Verrucomicrobiae bacterium]